MCGIGGLLRFDGGDVTEPVLRAMVELLRHRGPDDEGIHREGPLGLAHTRLSILDTTDAGHQPMAYADGLYHAVFNGEIYNFIEIRERLLALGHHFRTETDTEVVLAAYAQWGEDCLDHFNGMWGLAIWDREARRLFLSRDRFGVKPLFYWCDGNAFAFASEMKGLLAVPDIEVAFDPRALATAVRYPLQCESVEPALLSGVRRLLPGRSLTVDLSGRMRIRRWWRTLDHLVDIPPDEKRQVARFRELFEDSCSIRSRSDVPLATTLSGGLDSSSVHAMLAHIYDSGHRTERAAADKPTAFVGIVDGEEEEAEAARRMVAETGSKGVFTPLDAGEVLARIPDLVYAAEEITYLPIGQWNNYASLRANGFRVSLDGHGADELTAGYREYPLPAILDEFKRIKGMVAAARGMSTISIPRWLGEIVRKLPEPANRLQLEKFFPSPPVGRALTARPYPLASDAGRQDETDMKTFPAIQRRMYYEFHEGRQPYILRQFDRASMAHGVEVRSPFLDWRLVVYSFSLPMEIKIKNGFAKYVLRQAMDGVVPDDIRLRKKKVGFPTVILDLVKGPLKPLVEETLNGPLIERCAGIDGDAARAVARQHLARGETLFPWLLANAAMLHDRFRERAAAVRAKLS